MYASKDKIKNHEALFGNCLIESSSAILIAGKWPSFYTDEGSDILLRFHLTFSFCKGDLKNLNNNYHTALWKKQLNGSVAT